MDVSIVIVNYNTEKLLDECIQSIKRETNITFEIIVVDNASTDTSPNMVRTKHPDVQLIENSENVGFARANNQGFALARGRYFFMLNPDTIILDGAIDRLFQFMERYPDVSICGPRNIDGQGALIYNCDHFPSLWNTFCEYSNLCNRYPSISIFRRARMRDWDYSKPREVDKIMGATLFFRAGLYQELGGLDPNYFMYFEETDFCYRARQAGKKVIFLPHITILHYGGKSAENQSQEQVLHRTISAHFFRSQYYFYKKHYGLLRMMAIRGLDFSYGLSLLVRNAVRKDKIKRTLGLRKGRTLLTHSIRFFPMNGHP